VAPAGAERGVVTQRGRADAFMRHLLRVPDEHSRAAGRSAERLFSLSMVLSGLRCLLSYVIFPFVLPAIGAAAAVGPAIGIPVGLLALVFDAMGIRRFWLADHRYRWQMSAIYLAVMCLVSYLVVVDLVHALR
jgi:hypothetical protein